MRYRTLAIAAAGTIALGLVAAYGANADEGWRGGYGGPHHSGMGDGYGHWRDGRYDGRYGGHMGPQGGPHGGFGQNFAMFFDLIDINADNEVSREEALRPSGQRFARIDADKDGFLTASEIEAGAASMPGRPGGQMLARLDGDGDGKVSPAEFAVHGRMMFVAADANDDGVVSYQEFAGLRDRMHRGGTGDFEGRGPGPHGMMGGGEDVTGSGDDD